MNREVNVNLILEFIKANKMTISKFCKQSNISATTFHKAVKTGKAKYTTLFNIARVIEVRIIDLLKVSD